MSALQLMQCRARQQVLHATLEAIRLDRSYSALTTLGWRRKD